MGVCYIAFQPVRDRNTLQRFCPLRQSPQFPPKQALLPLFTITPTGDNQHSGKSNMLGPLSSSARVVLAPWQNDETWSFCTPWQNDESWCLKHIPLQPCPLAEEQRRAVGLGTTCRSRQARTARALVERGYDRRTVVHSASLCHALP